MAVDVGWIVRLPRKIDAPGHFTGVCIKTLRGTASDNDIAAAIDVGGDGAPRRQGVARRMNGACLRLFEATLARIIRFRLAPDLAPATSGFLARYQRVLVLDSTIACRSWRPVPDAPVPVTKKKAVDGRAAHCFWPGIRDREGRQIPKIAW